MSRPKQAAATPKQAAACVRVCSKDQKTDSPLDRQDRPPQDRHDHDDQSPVAKA